MWLKQLYSRNNHLINSVVPITGGLVMMLLGLYSRVVPHEGTLYDIKPLAIVTSEDNKPNLPQSIAKRIEELKARKESLDKGNNPAPISVDQIDNARKIDIPYREVPPYTMARIEAQLELGYFHPRYYRIYADDCLEEIKINQIKVEGFAPRCDWRNGYDVDLSSYLQNGVNKISLFIKNTEKQGGVSFQIPHYDWTYIVPLLGCFLILTALTRIFLRYCNGGKTPMALLLIVLAALLMRLLYFIPTYPGDRAYDWWGHEQYIRHMLNHWSLPSYRDGWQMYQPPLYYFLSAIWVLILQQLNLSSGDLMLDAQSFSLFIAVLSVFGIAWLSQRCFSSLTSSMLMVAPLCFLPGVVFLSTRVSNDVLVCLLLVISLGFLILWWKEQRWLHWISGALFLGLSMLTKASALQLAPAYMILPIFIKGRSALHRIKLIITLLITVGCISGWYYYQRLVSEGQPSVVGNIEWNDQSLRVDNSIASFIVFNPLKVIARPFNSTRDDWYRRTYHWEFYYRSAFSGEFHHGDGRWLYGSYLLLVSFPVALIIIFGIYNSLRRHFYEDMPYLLTFVFCMASLVALRIIHNISGFSDFRYTPLIAVPLGFYLARALPYVGPQAHGTAIACIIVLCFSCAFFILSFLWL